MRCLTRGIRAFRFERRVKGAMLPTQRAILPSSPTVAANGRLLYRILSSTLVLDFVDEFIN